MPRGCLQFVIVVFPDHTHLLFLLAFLDDVLIMGKSFDDHLENLDAALKPFRKFGLKLKPKKCIFFQKEVEFLGRLISNDKLSVTDADIQSVALWPVPACSKDVERFMGLANYQKFHQELFTVGRSIIQSGGEEEIPVDRRTTASF